MTLKKGDALNYELKIVFRCLTKDEVEIDLVDFEKFLKAAVDIYREANDL